MSAPKVISTHRIKLLQTGWSTFTDRFYPSGVLKRLEEQFAHPTIGDLLVVGDYGSMRIDLHNASHRTTKLYLKENGTELWADIEVLDTKCGRILNDLYAFKSMYYECLMAGRVNRFDEVDPNSVQFIRVSAFATYK